MTDVAIDRCAEGGTSQCGPQVARAGAERGGSCLVVVAPVHNVAPSGLSIHRGGPVDRPTGAGSITIQHSILAQAPTPPAGGAPLPSNGKLRVRDESYLLRSGSALAPPEQSRARRSVSCSDLGTEGIARCPDRGAESQQTA